MDSHRLRAERHTTRAWAFPPLAGVTHLDSVVYCIGGTYGPSGTKYCFKLTGTEEKWDRIANMLTGEKLKHTVVI